MKFNSKAISVPLSRISKKTWIAIVALILVQWPIWAYLSQPPIFIFDEAIYALNSLDMYHTGNPVVLTRGSELNLYNSKLPLVIWMQVLSIWVFGASEFAIRFPSAMAASITCLTLVLFSRYTLRDIRFGIVAILTLTTSYGYIRPHVTRTGDLDSVLACLITIYVCAVLHFILSKPKNGSTAIWTAGVAATGAFYAKSIAAFLPLPGLLVGALVANRAAALLKLRSTYLAAFMVLMVCGLYYVIREYLAPGYLNVVMYSEYGRYINTNHILSWHQQPISFYIFNLFNRGFFTPYIYALPVCIVIGFYSRHQRMATVVISIFIITYLVILSYPAVKLAWYDAPIYPFYALLFAIGFVLTWDLVKARISARNLLFPIVLIIVFSLPFASIMEKNKDRTGVSNAFEKEGYTIRHMADNLPGPKEFKVLVKHQYNAHYTHVEFYVNSFNDFKGYNIDLIRDMDSLTVHDTVLCCQQRILDSLQRTYFLTPIYTNDVQCQFMILDSIRGPI